MAELTQEDVSWLDKFKAEAVRFRNAFNSLVSLESYAATRPELQAEYNALYSRGETIKKTIDYITRTVDSVTGFFSKAWGSASSTFKNFFGLSGVPARFSPMAGPGELQMYARPGLGALPLIPIAVIASAVALMGKWASDVYLFERKATEQKRIEATGASPRAAADIVRGMTDGGGFLGILGNFKLPLMVAGGAYLFVKFVLPAIQARRG